MKHIGLIILLIVVTACAVLAQTADKAVPPGRSAEQLVAAHVSPVKK